MHVQLQSQQCPGVTLQPQVPKIPTLTHTPHVPQRWAVAQPHITNVATLRSIRSRESGHGGGRLWAVAQPHITNVATLRSIRSREFTEGI